MTEYANLHWCVHKNGVQVGCATRLRLKAPTCVSGNAAAFPLRVGSLRGHAHHLLLRGV